MVHWTSIGFLAISAITVATAVSPPTCQSIAPTQQTLVNVKTANLTVPDNPFGVVYASNDIAFASFARGSVGVLNTSLSPPKLIGEVPLPAPYHLPNYAVSGVAITRDKRTLYVTVGKGALAIDVKRAVAGAANPIVGYLNGSNANGTVGTSAIEVTLSLDNKYAFVSQEYGGNLTKRRGAVEVFSINRSWNGTVSSAFIGYIVLGDAVVGMALSKDGSKLYATSELNGNYNTTQGTLSVLDIETLKTTPSKALLATADAGCSPVRIAVSPSGKHVWVTARESNMLLAFDTVKLNVNSSNALVASVQVGTSPVGVTFVNNGRHIITADSNRFNTANTTSGLTVVDVRAALGGKQGFPRISTGIFPREFAVSPDGKTLLVSDYGNAVNSTKVLETVDLRDL